MWGSYLSGGAVGRACYSLRWPCMAHLTSQRFCTFYCRVSLYKSLWGNCCINNTELHRVHYSSLSEGITVSVFSTNLHPWGSDDIKSGNHVGDKVHHLGEALLADTPRAVDEEHHICFGAFADWGKKKKKKESMSPQASCCIITWHN